ncbi:MAG: pentapeptide repeat-containing protein [Desulfosporosinus sp.]|nr:pentapeptide repeat-containing protein [Desulfosporosinus sp.]
MNKKLINYLDEVFSPYRDLQSVKELKEELSNDLQEKLSDLKNQGYEEEVAYNMTIDSIGDISAIIESISVKSRELQQMVSQDFSNINLQKSDFKGVKVHEGKFNGSALKESDFSNSDLSKSTFKGTDLQNSDFKKVTIHDGSFNGSALKGSDFSDSDLTNTSFKGCDLTNVRFEVLILQEQN